MIELKNNPAGNFFLLAGPCVIEGEDMAMRIAERVVAITDKLQIPYVFKGSYRKANRSRLDSFMGIGDEKALKILKKSARHIRSTHRNRHPCRRRSCHGSRICRYSANPCFPLQTNRPASSRSQDRQDRQYKERTVPLSACHAIRCRQGGGSRQ